MNSIRSWRGEWVQQICGKDTIEFRLALGVTQSREKSELRITLNVSIFMMLVYIAEFTLLIRTLFPDYERSYIVKESAIVLNQRRNLPPFCFARHLKDPGGRTMTEPSIDWNTGERSEFVDIGTHRLRLTALGCSRNPCDPAVLIIPGLGSSITSWAAVRRQLAQFIRVYSYDRSGYGESDLSTETPTSTTIAYELDLLLRKARVAPPFIVVAHSWGGILSREFLAVRPDYVTGMVFVEANQEQTLARLDWRLLANSPILTGVDRAKVLKTDSSHKLTVEEWEVYQAAEATEKHQKQAALEYEQYPHSFPVLAAKSQLKRDPPILGSRPVCVIKGDNGRDFQELFRAGIEIGNGNESERAAFKDILSTWDENDQALQMGNLKLSSRQNYFQVPLSGHHLQLTAPDGIVRGVKWVVENIK